MQEVNAKQKRTGTTAGPQTETEFVAKFEAGHQETIMQLAKAVVRAAAAKRSTPRSALTSSCCA